jgi:hypothetical protein
LLDRSLSGVEAARLNLIRHAPLEVMVQTVPARARRSEAAKSNSTEQNKNPNWDSE